ncbi:hypothetical protein MKW92_000055 [Papaver armeniacum]|nr:hypothetical protein MKW92_000055 [Papaver armeniacum]
MDAVPFIRTKAALQDSNGHQQTVEENLWNQMLQIWDEVGESDGKPYEMLRQINQECLDIYKRKVDEAAAKSSALHPWVSDNAFWANTTCETLMKRLEEIWHEDDVGEDERNEMLQQLDQECLEVYKRKAAESANRRELLHLELANAKLELFKFASALGLENIPFKLTGNINKQLEAVRLNQEHLLLLKDRRKVVFADARSRILKLREEIAGNSKLTEQAEAPAVSEDDLSLKKLAELHCEILELQEKAALQDLEEVAEGRQKLSETQQTELAAVAFRADTTCATLLKQLHQIWDEVGESDGDRNEMLRQINQECLDIYKKNVDQAGKLSAHLSQQMQHKVGEEDDKHNDMLHQIDQELFRVYEIKVDEAAKSSALLRQELIGAKIELSRLASTLGMKTIPDKSTRTIRYQLASIHLKLKQLAVLKDKRQMLFADVQSQIQKIRAEITEQAPEAPTVNEDDLSLNKLDELRSELQVFQEKSDCFKVSKVLACVTTVRDLCPVLGINFVNFINEVYPNLTKSINHGTFSELAKTVELLKREELEKTSSKLVKTVEFLKKEKMDRLRTVQHLAAQLFELWSLIDTSPEERSMFDHVTCYISATVDEVTLPRALDLAWIEDAKWEVRRLEVKVSTEEDPNKEHNERARLKFLKAHDSVRAVYDLCSVLGMDFLNITDEVRPGLVMGLRADIIDDEILLKLAKTVENLKQEKMQRLEMLQELAGQLYDLWNFMDTSPEDRSSFQHVTRNISATVDEVTQPEALAVSCINHAKVEVERLELLKACKVTEIPSKTYPEAA